MTNTGHGYIVGLFLCGRLVAMLGILWVGPGDGPDKTLLGLVLSQRIKGPPTCSQSISTLVRKNVIVPAGLGRDPRNSRRSSQPQEVVQCYSSHEETQKHLWWHPASGGGVRFWEA